VECIVLGDLRDPFEEGTDGGTEGLDIDAAVEGMKDCTFGSNFFFWILFVCC
jgi:hypothetical protein